MGTDTRSILRVGVTRKTITSGTDIFSAAIVERNQPEYTGPDIKPNTVGMAGYTLEVLSDTTGTLNIIIDDGTIHDLTIPVSLTEDKLHLQKFYIRPEWTWNLQFSTGAVFEVLMVMEHGGVV